MGTSGKILAFVMILKQLRVTGLRATGSEQVLYSNIVI